MEIKQLQICGCFFYGVKWGVWGLKMVTCVNQCVSRKITKTLIIYKVYKDADDKRAKDGLSVRNVAKHLHSSMELTNILCRKI